MHFMFGMSQDPFGINPRGNQNKRSGTQTQIEVFVPDTTILDYFTLSDKNKIYNFSDTLIDDKEKYLVSRTFENAALTLGNSGSAAKEIMYRPRSDIFTDIGFHQYDIYAKTIDSIQFFKLNRAYNDLFFSPVGGSQNFVAKAIFAREFANNINITIDFDRINQVGFYNDQNTKATSLAVGLWQKKPDKRHEWYFTFMANNFNEKHNGGIDINLNTDPFYSDPQFRITRTSIPTLLATGSSGDTRHQKFSYGLDNYFKSKSKKYNIHHRFQFENGYYRFSDENTSTISDSTVYLDYLTEGRGLRFLNTFSRWTNQVVVGFQSKGFDIEIGAIYKYLNLNNTIEQNNFHDVVAYSALKFKLQKIGQLSAKLQLGLGQNAGNINLDGRLDISAVKGLNLQAFLNILRYDPSVLSERVYVTNQLVYANDFNKINEFIIGGKLKVRKLNLSVEFTSGLIDQATYWDENALPVQLDGSTEYIKLVAKHKLFWKFIGIENSAVYQSFTNNIYNLPEWHSLSNGFIQFRLFKKRLLSRIGILFYHNVYDGDLKFMPVTGAFYPGENTVAYTPYSELYGSFQVDRFFLFLKMENYSDALLRKVQYQIVNYPQLDAKIRMGIRWQIFD